MTETRERYLKKNNMALVTFNLKSNQFDSNDTYSLNEVLTSARPNLPPLIVVWK